MKCRATRLVVAVLLLLNFVESTVISALQHLPTKTCTCMYTCTLCTYIVNVQVFNHVCTIVKAHINSDLCTVSLKHVHVSMIVCTCTVQVTWNLYSSVECERLYSRV